MLPLFRRSFQHRPFRRTFWGSCGSLPICAYQFAVGLPQPHYCLPALRRQFRSFHQSNNPHAAPARPRTVRHTHD
nr:MAG TPA: hypothetical protein [Herelleviridae sp.]